MPQAPGRRTALSGHHWPFLALSGPHASCSLGTTNPCGPQAQLPSQGSLKRVFKLLLPILTWRVYSRPSPARCWWNCLPSVDRTPVRVDGCTACLVVVCAVLLAFSPAPDTHSSQGTAAAPWSRVTAGGEALLSRTSVLSGPRQASSTPPYILPLLHHDVGSAVLRSPGAAEGASKGGCIKAWAFAFHEGSWRLHGGREVTGAHCCFLRPELPWLLQLQLHFFVQCCSDAAVFQQHSPL